MDHYPDMQSADSGANWVADTGNFTARLTGRTNQYGQIGTDPNTYPFGPYLQKFPINAVNKKSTIRVDGAAAGAGSDGWHFNSTNGRVSADDSAAHAAL
jgi:hypothetical protein